jgi:hypothetical protein
MPKFDGTGPEGKGPMTESGSSYCIVPLNTTKEELEFLKNREQNLKKQLRHVTTRIKRIERSERQKEVAR